LGKKRVSFFFLVFCLMVVVILLGIGQVTPTYNFDFQKSGTMRNHVGRFSVMSPRHFFFCMLGPCSFFASSTKRYGFLHTM
jgi:hypothetical protein